MYPGFEQKLLTLIQKCSMEDKVLIASEQHKYAQAFRPVSAAACLQRLAPGSYYFLCPAAAACRLFL